MRVDIVVQDLERDDGTVSRRIVGRVPDVDLTATLSPLLEALEVLPEDRREHFRDRFRRLADAVILETPAGGGLLPRRSLALDALIKEAREAAAEAVA